MQPIKILVVDDEPQIERLILQRFRREVRREEYEFVFGQDGQEALSIIRKDTEIDIVLTDINMPIMDGLTLINIVRSEKPLLKMLVISAYGDMQNIRRAMNLGAFDFLTKPLDISDLKTTLQKTLKELELLKKIKKAKELEQENEKLEKINELKSLFFTNISHEFRTPLTIITGMASQIENRPQKWLKKGVQMIQRNSSELLNLVNQILDLRKLDVGELSLNLKTQAIQPFLLYIFETFQTYAETLDVKLRLEQQLEDLVMDFDEEKLQRILSNLLINAIKFTPAGGRVDLIIEQVEKYLKIQVKDTGMGIPAKQLPHIFDRFYQIETEKQHNHIGTGIGLAMVKALVQLMQGRIEVKSQIEKGTSFTVQIPISQSNPAPSNISPISSQTNGTFSSLNLSHPVLFEKSARALDLPSLLIIEDHPDIAQYIVACLEGKYQTTIATDGQAGIDKALAQMPDLIVSDVMMPKKNGFEVCQILKNTKECLRLSQDGVNISVELNDIQRSHLILQKV